MNKYNFLYMHLWAGYTGYDYNFFFCIYRWDTLGMMMIMMMMIMTMMTSKGKGKGHSKYSAQGSVRVGVFFLKDMDTPYLFPQGGSKEDACSQETPQLIRAPSRGQTPDLLLNMQMFYPLSHKCFWLMTYKVII